MNWKDHYERSTVSAQTAVKAIKSKDRVVLAHACGEPRGLGGNGRACRGA